MYPTSLAIWKVITLAGRHILLAVHVCNDLLSVPVVQMADKMQCFKNSSDDLICIWHCNIIKVSCATTP